MPPCAQSHAGFGRDGGGPALRCSPEGPLGAPGARRSSAVSGNIVETSYTRSGCNWAVRSSRHAAGSCGGTPLGPSRPMGVVGAGSERGLVSAPGPDGVFRRILTILRRNECPCARFFWTGHRVFWAGGSILTFASRSLDSLANVRIKEPPAKITCSWSFGFDIRRTNPPHDGSRMSNLHHKCARRHRTCTEPPLRRRAP